MRVLRTRIPARAIGAVLLIGAMLNCTVEAAKSKFNNVLAIGDQAPEWENLPGVDGKPHSLADFRDAKAVVIVFTCNHCPVAKMHEDRLIELAKKFEKDVQVVAISVSRNAADGLDKMKIRASQKKYPFPYLYDETQKTGRNYGATATPHFFLLDGERKITYMGAFDDSTLEPGKAQKHYLVDALTAMLEGKEPRVRESLQRGCAIEYE